jgi:hypothetical protein
MPRRKDFLDDTPTFSYRRVDDFSALPPTDEKSVDVAILDMNHRWPNLGHDAIVQILHEISDRIEEFREEGLRLRVFSFDVRQRLLVPDAERFHLFIGTGGPGHLDPRRNDGVSEGTQGIAEDPAWESELFSLFDRIKADEGRALFAVCHTFGLVCRWGGFAEPRLRGEEKGGKSSGLVTNVLTSDALEHPWFSRFSSELSDRRTFGVLDSRLYDLIVDPARLPEGSTVISFEEDPGDTLTMIELARDAGGMMPRIFAVNHHPEVVDRKHVMSVLNEKLERGEVTQEWYDERARVFADEISGAERERELRRTSHFAFIAPLEFHVRRLVATHTAAGASRT